MTTDQSSGQRDFAEPSMDLIQRIAQLTRTLRVSMRELGLDQAIKDAAHAIPDARDRLHYVAQMTEQAANRVLNAAEQIQPWQEAMQRDAKALDARWQDWFDHPVELDQARSLVDDTRAFLKDVPEKTQASQNNVMEIIMAQDFQDLTGQVIMKMLGVIGAIETELVQVLIDNVPQEKREETKTLLNGPVVNAAGKSDVVTNQDQVDDLLASLGF
ncbi:Chemotaxis response-phosphatase CheZ [Castellaniella defragrans 65Phen]|uniref:Protein phosphatase CheZ n=2 Tax=Castellaniella defragrans TaxID=75697 RepID=W8X4I1_CASD6|nr:protein phosphatase CheZ [Castellaniella defragrans]CDM24837.1 Chemotaxis response-phosphatase CheZ [Castellaniella defragrans 65Phen]